MIISDMPQSIFLEAGDKLLELPESPYDSEDLFQVVLAKYPNLLAGSQMDVEKPRRWLFIMREASIPGDMGAGGRWSLDHLFLDQDGIPTLVEVKRGTDTRLRREVVGQMLDYAANATVYWPVDRIRLMFEERCRIENVNPEETLTEFLAGSDQEEFWHNVKTNFQTGRIRMVFLADRIPPELRRVVEFLNSQMDRAEVLAVEVKRYSGQGQTTYVPRVIGLTTEAESRKRPEGRTWDETSFFQELANRHTTSEVQTARDILDWAKLKATEVWYGRGHKDGSFVPVYTREDVEYQLFAVYTYGSVEIYFQHCLNKPAFAPEAKRLELLQKLNQVPSVELPPDSITRRPSIPLAILAQPGALKKFIGAFEWFFDEVNSTKVQV